MFCVLLRLEQGAHRSTTTTSPPGCRTSSEDEIKRVDYSYASYDRPHNFVAQLHLPDAEGRGRRARRDRERLADLRHLPLDERPARTRQLLDPRASAPRTSPATTATPPRASCSPATRAAARAAIPYKQINTSCFAPPQPGSDGAESARFFLRDPPINNLDLSLSKVFPIGKQVRLEVRLDAFNALNHTQFTGVNSTRSNFASLTDRDHHEPAVRREREPGPQQRLRRDQRRGRRRARCSSSRGSRSRLVMTGPAPQSADLFGPAPTPAAAARHRPARLHDFRSAGESTPDEHSSPRLPRFTRGVWPRSRSSWP